MKAHLQRLLEHFPPLYLKLLHLKRLRHWSRQWIVSRDTAVTIDGFPRSGNSFAHAAFRMAQPEKVRIATHVHSAAQIQESARLGVPTIVLVRQPKDVFLSSIALAEEIKVREEKVSGPSDFTAMAKRILRDYVAFYERVARLADKVIIADFPLVTDDFGEIIRRVNRKYGTGFGIYSKDDSGDERVFENGGYHLSPNEVRNSIKERIREGVDWEAIGGYLEAAEAVYARMQAIASRQGETCGSGVKP